MLLRKKRKSLLVDIAFFIGVALILVASYFLYRINIIQSQLILRQLSAEASTIEKYFSERVLYTGSILGYMGRQIQQHAGSNRQVDLYFIDKLFQAFGKDPRTHDVLSSTIIGWANTRYQVLVDGKYRVMQKPIDLSIRDYLPETAKEPWVIKLGQPVIGSTSKVWILPAGVGVTDKHNRWVGSLIIGFSQKLLRENFKKILDTEGMNVALMDLTGQVLIEAPSYFISNTIPLAEKVKRIPLPSKGEKRLVEKIKPFYHIGPFGWGTSYYYYKIPNYDYVIFLSLSNPISPQKVTELILAYLPELCGISLLFIMGGMFLRRRIVQPISMIAQVMHALSVPSHGKKIRLSIRFPKALSSEIYELVKGTVRLKMMKQKNEQLLRDVQHARDEALEASKAKTDFMAYTAHELRSPLSGIISSSECIQKKLFGENLEKYLEYADIINAHSQDLMRFVEDLLEQVSLENSQLNIKDNEYVVIADSIERSIKLNISRATKCGIQIDTIIEPNLPRLRGDGQRIRQILVNLITNAIKYSPSKTRITISAGMERNWLTITVSDQGYGMTEEQVQKALTKYGTVENPNTGKVESIGLGLPLTVELVALHDGVFDIESSPGKGTTITLRFPLSRLKPAR